MYSMKKIAEKALRLRELERQMNDLKVEMDILKDQLKADMEKRGVTELIGDNYKITWNPYVSNRFDEGVFKSEHSKLYEKYLRARESRRFLVK